MYEKIIENMTQLLNTTSSNCVVDHHTLIKQQIKLKVFLGGTCNGRDYRQDLIPMLKIPYFNPVVGDWSPQAQENEKTEKRNKCGIHLYIITPEFKGVFSIAEAVQSSNTQNVITVFCVMNREIYDPHTLKSLEATEELLRDNGAIITRSIGHTAEILNSYTNTSLPVPEDFSSTIQAMSPTPITVVTPGPVTLGKTMKPKKEENKDEKEL